MSAARVFIAPGSTIGGMQVATGTVVAGRVVVEGMELAEGEIVTILTREPDKEVHLSAEEETELLEAVAEADRGDTISADELFARLNRND